MEVFSSELITKSRFPSGLPFQVRAVEVQHPACFGLEVGVAGEDPRAPGPWANDVFGEPPSDSGAGDVGHDPAGDGFGGEVRDMEP